MILLVSACLLGLPCRYDGQSKPVPFIMALSQHHTLIPVCPEQLGGRPTPRPPVEIHQGRVIEQNGADHTEAFLLGARLTVQIARLTKAQGAILKSKSPSCGLNARYDGTFTRHLIPESGLAAQALQQAGILVYSEDQLEKGGAQCFPI
ncbi:MAG TPA: DUF523 domain-containing protein [Firmicutes bacterium]|nr:DUF523 domain-containing protein [Bacillota bacterium]